MWLSQLNSRGAPFPAGEKAERAVKLGATTPLMFASLALLSSDALFGFVGDPCISRLRELGLVRAAGLLELAGITALAVNILGTFVLKPSHIHKQPFIVKISRTAEKEPV